MSDSEGSDSVTKIKSEAVPADSDSGEEIDPDIYTVERIVDRRKNCGITEYEVKWKNYHSSENTWEPERNIFDQSLIDDFLLGRKKEKRKRQEKLEQLDSETKNLKDIQLKNKQEKEMGKNKRKDKLKGFIVSSDSVGSTDEEASKNRMPPPRVSSKGDRKTKRKESGQQMTFKKEGSDSYKSQKQRAPDSNSKPESLLVLEETSSSFAKRDMKLKKEPGKKSGTGDKLRPPPSHQDVDISNILGERKMKPSHSKKVNKGKVLKDKTGAIQNRTSKKEKDTRIQIPKNLYTESETGLGRGYKIDFVIGLRQNESGHIFYLVKYVGDQEEEDEYVEFVLSTIVVDHAPMKVIEYYQSILKFIPMSELQNRRLTKIVPDSDSAWSSSNSCSGASSTSGGSSDAKDELLGLEEDFKDIALKHVDSP